MAIVKNLNDVFEKAETPDELKIWLWQLDIKNISDLVGYVEKEFYEREWRDLVHGAFPVVVAQEAQAAVGAVEGVVGVDRAPFQAILLAYARFMIQF